MAAAERATRSDARRNRARIVDVAGAAFREEGFEVGVDELARRAGIGVATLYRHFPAKTDLILAVMESTLDELDAVTRKALAGSDSRLAVARFLRAAIALQRRNRGLVEA